MPLAILLAAVLASAAPPQLTLTPKTAALRIAVAGDSGSGAETLAKAISRVHETAPLDAILLTGDNFYPCGVTSVDDPRWSLARPLTRVGIPIFPVLGNHDYCGKSVPDAQIQATGVLPHWRFPAPQYAVRTPVADFAFLNTTPWVRGENAPIASMIRGTFATSSTPWRIVVGHHPVISSGWHGYFPRDEVKRMRELIPVLRETRADLYICGHDHHVELIRGRMLHLISGAGSEPVPPIKLRATTVFPEEIRRERIGFAVVEITSRAIRVRVYDSNGKPRTNWLSGRVRHEPGRHRPVLFQHLDKADENVVGSNAELAEPRDDVAVDRALGRIGAPFIERDLNDDQLLGALHVRTARE
jgi:acid phosphatase